MEITCFPFFVSLAGGTLFFNFTLWIVSLAGGTLFFTLTIWVVDLVWVCDVCGKEFKYHGYLSIHRRIHTGELPFTCKLCSKQFIVASSLQSHLQRFHKIKHKISKWYSKWCFREKVFSHIEHLYGLTPEWSLSCVRMCVFWENVLPHVAQLYGLSCVCERKCTNNDCLCPKDKDKKRHKCGYCEKSLCSASSLAAHERLHTLEKPFKCDICQKTFVQSSNLTTHKLIHSDLKPYVCELCTKPFRHKQSLLVHLRSHTQERPYSCATCGKTTFLVLILRMNLHVSL
jgi:KRAB domain-containing zinc finger protein